VDGFIPEMNKFPKISIESKNRFPQFNPRKGNVKQFHFYGWEKGGA
jgi:hypothetical protein